MNASNLAEVNAEVNAFPYKSDPERYGQADFWAEANAGGSDCEDFALAKLHRLLDRGWSIDDLRLACCYVEPFEIIDKITGERRWATMDERYHAVLEVHTDDGPRILDNRQQWPVTLEQLHNIGYAPDRIQREGGSVKWKTWKWEV